MRNPFGRVANPPLQLLPGNLLPLAPSRAIGSANLRGGTLDDLVRDQVMSMKTTFTPGTYRRKVAGVLARRLVERLWGEAA